jgi:DNA-binding HxlR family transcriptional regulator
MSSPSNRFRRVNLEDLKLASGVMNGRWKTTILYWLAAEPRRFGVLRRAVEGISEKVLIQQLKELERDGLVSRSVEATVPPKVEYAITEHGYTLCKVVETIAAWGARHRQHVAAVTHGDDGDDGSSPVPD